MLEAGYSLELSESLLTMDMNPEQTEEVMASGLSKDACSSGVLTVSEDGFKIMLTVCKHLMLYLIIVILLN